MFFPLAFCSIDGVSPFGGYVPLVALFHWRLFSLGGSFPLGGSFSLGDSFPSVCFSFGGPFPLVALFHWWFFSLGDSFPFGGSFLTIALFPYWLFLVRELIVMFLYVG